MAPTNELNGVANRILLALPQATLERIRPALRPVNTTRSQVIARITEPIEHMYFVNRGLVSLIKTMRDGRTVEIGAVGIEGVTDPHALFGIEKAPFDSIIQIAGTALRIRRGSLQTEVAKDDTFHEIMQDYARFTFRQLAQTAACNRLHSLEERCCRWLLIAHDSTLSDTFPLTQEFLAMMLGVQRAGVSIAASLLKRAGLIDYVRGRVTVKNRAGLEEAACECYGAIQTELEDLFGVQRWPEVPQHR